MARSTFKVLFYVNGSKEKNGIVPIMGRVTINEDCGADSVVSRNIPKNALGREKENKAKGKSRVGTRHQPCPLTTSRRKSSNITSAFQTARHLLRLRWCATPIRESAASMRRC